MAEVWPLYERHAAAFDRDRARNGMETKHLRSVLARLPRNAEVLDLGCGGGEPIARYFIENGCKVTGVDAAPAMIALCRARFPAQEWIVGDMRALSLGRTFDAVLAWNSFFHLAAGDQRHMFGVFRDHLKPAGVLLFTSGTEAGEAAGDFYGDRLYHASLDTAEYRRLLDGHGFAVLFHTVNDPECGGHTVWLAERGR